MNKNQNQMKMVWITAAWPPDLMGPATGIVQRAKFFDNFDDVDLTVLVPKQKDGTFERTDVKDVRSYSSKPWNLRKFNRTANLKGGREIEKIIRELKPDYIMNADPTRLYLGSTWKNPGISWAKKNNVPYIGYHHTDFIGFSDFNPPWNHLSFIVKLIMKRSFKNLDQTLCASKMALDNAISFNAPNPFTINFDGVDIDEFSPDKKDEKYIENLLGYKPEGPVILYFGRISQEKRLDLIIEAVDTLQKTPGYEKTSLIVAGGGNYPAEIEKIKALAKKINKPELVHFPGIIRGLERQKIVASVDIMVNACIYETFGLSIAEAMAAETIVVTANAGAPAEYIKDGVNGFLVPPLKSDEIVKGFKRALTSDRKQIGKNARETIVSKYSMEEICTTLHDYFINKNN